jgi:hypothetical protein
MEFLELLEFSLGELTPTISSELLEWASGIGLSSLLQQLIEAFGEQYMNCRICNGENNVAWVVTLFKKGHARRDLLS